MNVPKAAAAGAADFKGWYVVVWLTPGAVSWPRRCACCSKRPETTARATDGDRSLAEYPICRPCLRHAKIDDAAMGFSLVVGALAVLGGWVAAFGFSVMRWIVLQGLLMLLAWLLVTAGIYGLISLFVGHKRSSCSDAGWPVEAYRPAGFGDSLGKDAERTDERNLRLWCAEAARRLGSSAYGLQFRNHEYAREFIRENGGDATRVQFIAEAM